MILQSIQLKNWRNFYGENPKIHFATGKAQKLTIIHAANNAGKTNILNALTWLLYERLTPNFREPKQLINEQALRETEVGSTVACTVTCEFKHSGRNYRAARAAYCKRLESVAGSYHHLATKELKLLYQSDAGDWKTDPNPQITVNTIMPSAIHDLFFFDGEDIRAKFEPKRQEEELAGQMRKFFGLNVITDIQHAMEQAERLLRKNMKKGADSGLQEILEKKDQLEALLKSEKDTIAENQSKVTAANDVIKKISDILKSKQEARNLQIKRDQLNKDKDRLEDDLRSNTKERTKLINTSGYITFLKSPLAGLESQIQTLKQHGELPADVKRPFIQNLLDTKRCICERGLSPGNDVKARDNVMAWLERSGMSEVEERVMRMQGSLSQLKTSEADFFNALDEKQRDRKRLIKDRTNTITLLSEISTKLQNSTEEEIKKLEEKREKEREKRSDAKAAIKHADQQTRTFAIEFAKNQLLLDNYAAKDKASKLAKKKQRIATLSLQMIQNLYDRTDKQVRKELLEKITAHFAELTASRYRPTLTENYELKIYFSEHDDAMPAALAGGQTQALAFAFIGGIMEIQKERHKKEQDTLALQDEEAEYPVVMDSPFGTMGGDYRRNLVEFIPEVADQVILFVRDDQWDDQVADILLPITGKTYLLQFHSINKQHRSDKTITFGEREYSYVVDSQTGHEHSEIKAIGNV